MTRLVRADTELMLRAAQEMQRSSSALLEQFATAQQAMQNLQGTPWSGYHRTVIEERWNALNVQFQPTTTTLDDLALRLIRTAEAIDAAAVTFGDSAAIGGPGSFLANLEAMLSSLSPAQLLSMGWAATNPIGLLAALPYTPWGQTLLGGGQGTYDPALGATNTGLANSGPPARVYSANGIGSKSTAAGEPDESGKTLKETFAKARYDATEFHPTPAVYNTNWQTNYSANDWWGLGPAINEVTSTLNLGVGVSEVFNEYVKGENGPYTQQTMQWIMQDLKEHPLLPGQKVVLVGHSGGGAIVTNLAGMLENENVDVQAVVTMGSPVANYDLAAQYADIHQIRDHHDYIGLPVIRASEGASSYPLSINPLVSLIGAELLLRNSNPNARHTTTHSKTEAYETIRGHSSYHDNPVVAHILGQYTGGQSQATPQPTAALPGGVR